MISRILKLAGLGTIFLVVAGTSAYLTLTFIIKSEDKVIVPNLVGKNVVAALELLSDLELNTKVTGSTYSQHVPKNHVTFQDPEAGSEIKKDRDVRIIISKGAKNIFMPNLIGLSEQQARMIMEENEITRGHLSRTYSKLAEKNHVIMQIPSAGEMITRGSAVDLLVSIGPRPVEYKMPDLSGLLLDEALFIIEKTHLSVGTIRSSFDNDEPRNLIVRQEPPSGHRVIEKSPVNLIINRPPGKTGIDRSHRPLYGSLLQHQVVNGILKKRLRVELENSERSIDIFDDFVKPGEPVWILIPREQEATVFIFEDDKLVRTQIFEAW